MDCCACCLASSEKSLALSWICAPATAGNNITAETSEAANQPRGREADERGAERFLMSSPVKRAAYTVRSRGQRQDRSRPATPAHIAIVGKFISGRDSRIL